MESASASAPGVVAMEIPVRGALPVVEEDEGFSAPTPGSEERLRYRRGGGRRRRGVPFNRGSYYMLIVIGEIGTEHQLEAARALIERDASPAPYQTHPSPLTSSHRCQGVDNSAAPCRARHHTCSAHYGIDPFTQQSFFSFLAGIRSWDVDLQCCDLDQQLQLFITRHSAHFSSEVRGQCDYGARRASGPVMTEYS
ncbi:microtubule-associated protein 1B-like protein [Lates japonicus]|uniref:Microtubule-associated protein 1B-like protein n=1 Tax=Lates japonicus TaxID=270547 RepID=A0AAD3MXD1_LATJO|nr:microtubule-associated protein 1B-like protein [Lates japonicus]